MIDFAVVGSGFGGSVAALRLREKGYDVVVLEQGPRVTPEHMQAASHSLRRLIWAPGLGMRGFFSQRFFRHCGVVAGVGVGGGSLVYAAVLLEPSPEFFVDPSWSRLGVDWKKELAPHYETAKRMLGVAVCPEMGRMDEWLRRTAESMGAARSFGPVPLGIYFGKPELTEPDPFFGGRGPARTGCRSCGACLTGCPYGSKNSLDLNYLHLAEASGARVLAQREVSAIRPLTHGGYELSLVNPLARREHLGPLQARNVVVSAGVLGSVDLLLRCRDELRTLPNLSRELGRIVRTNSETVVGILARDPKTDLTKGTTISSHFFPEPRTHITQNRFPQGYSFFRWQAGPLVDGRPVWWRGLKTLAMFLLHPLCSTASWWARNWYKRITVLTVMRQDDSQIALGRGRRVFGLLGKSLVSRRVRGRPIPASYLAVANRAARIFAGHSGGVPHNVLLDTLAGMSTTAHILGGCHMGDSRASGVIDTSHRVFGYPGLYVIDGSAVSANVGVNPSLTITALAERCMSLIPPKATRH